MATARIDIRLDEKIKVKAEKASALLGKSTLTEYLVTLLDNDASQVIAEHESMMVRDDIFDTFMTACDKARKPNKALRDAVTYTQGKGIK